MAFFTVLTNKLYTLWAGIRTNKPFLDLPLMLWILWMITNSIWISITTVWMTITTIWNTYEMEFKLWTMWITITTYSDPLDLVFKVWLSVMTFVIFRVAIKCQEKINNLQHVFNANINRLTDCQNHQIRIEQTRYEKLVSFLEKTIRTIDARFRAEKIKNILKKLQKQKDSALKELNCLADNLDVHFKRIQKAKTAGAVASVSGCVLVCTGLILIPFSFGTSSILTIVGGAISGAGGVTIGGSSIVDAVLTSTKRDSVKKILNDYNTTMNEVKAECLEVGHILNTSCNGNIEIEFNTWCSFWRKLVLGVTATSTGSWSAIANPIMNSLRLATMSEDIATASLRGIAVTGRVLTIAGGVVGILLLPLDIYTLVNSAIDVHKNNPHKVSVNIREICKKINDDFPPDHEIQYMINETFYRRLMCANTSNV